MSLFEAIRNNIVTVTTSTGFLLRLWVKLLAAKAKQRRALVTLTPTTERRSRLLRGSFVTVTFPWGTTVTIVPLAAYNRPPRPATRSEGNAIGLEALLAKRSGRGRSQHPRLSQTRAGGRF